MIQVSQVVTCLLLGRKRR